MKSVLARISAAAFVLALMPLVAHAEDSPSVPQLTSAQSDFIEHCSGCHGLNGNSAPAAIPVLRDRVGYFMCTKEGREYLIRLPNVAHAPISDNQQLAELMNFVVFGLGGPSAPPHAKPYTADEVKRLRPQVLDNVSLVAAREVVVDHLIRDCGAPASLKLFFDGQVGTPSP